jgi:hypothetical protein
MPCDYGVDLGFEPEHIDRKSLYVSLEERIKYLHHFLEWSSGMYWFILLHVPYSYANLLLV